MSEDLLKPRSSPLQKQHRETRAPTRLAERRPDFRQNGVLCGDRGMYRPTIALQTIHRLGPVRHALAQRAIAGFLEVHAPFAPPLSDRARDLVDKQTRRAAAPDAPAGGGRSTPTETG